METYIKIGTTILEKYIAHAHKNSLDDESEYFPVLKIIIRGVVESYNGSDNDRKIIGHTLVEFVKQDYINIWIKNAKKDEDNHDIKEETKDAQKQFKIFYNKKS